MFFYRHRCRLTTIFVIYLFWCMLPSTVKAAPATSDHALTIQEVKQGSLLLKTDQTKRYLPAPTLQTNVEISVTGLMARATVKQQFENPGSEWVEGVYVFPLPETAAVDHLRMIIGERIIEGMIQERAQAKKTYTTAKKNGQRASLLEQERPNMFTASVANIGPGHMITIEIEYQETLRYDQGRFHLRFPMVVGPRYIPGHPQLISERLPGVYGHGWGINTNQVPDASRITPPVQHPDNGPINPVSLTINLDPGFPLSRLESLYHPVLTAQAQASRYTISLKDGTVPADRDFELIWEPTAHQDPRAALFFEQKNGDTFSFMMILPPTADVGKTTSQPREVIFVIDTSGSMYGSSIDQAKAALTLTLDRLTPRDRFNIIQFNNTTEALFPDSRAASQRTVRHAVRYVAHLKADGGTEMLPAMKRALRNSDGGAQLRQVIFITDGQIGNETALFETIRQHLQRSRIFPIGIGSAPNSYFMRKAAEFGRGTFTHIGNAIEVKEKMDRVFRKLAHPALTDIHVVPSSPTEMEIVPERIPDLYAGEPVIAAWKSASPVEEITVKGRIGQVPWETTLSLNTPSPREGIAVYWARQKIDSLMNQHIGHQHKEPFRERIIDIARQHHLVSRYTSLVAVEVTPARSQTQLLHTHALKTNLPHGQDYVAIFGLTQGATPGPIHLMAGLLMLTLALALYCVKSHRT